jgi:hypothetical protein
MLRALIQKIKFFQFVLAHPLNRANKWAALMRYFRWQFGSRLVPGDVLVPFVDKTLLRICPSMTGATGNIYAGLHEFEDMAFVLHLLRENDLFVDVGANIAPIPSWRVARSALDAFQSNQSKHFSSA